LSFPRYPKYKPSGVEWLGDVPEHWEVKRLKRACHVFPSNVDKKSYEGETPVRLCNYTDVYHNETITADMDFMAATASTDQISKFTLRGGDTIITKDSETADDIAIGAYVPVDLPGVVCGYHLSMVRPMRETDGAFVKRFFDSSYAKSCFAVRANGLTRVGLGQYELDNVEIPFPPSLEQTRIAAFLDRETGKIDTLVAEQRRLMTLLKEKRQAVISHAVTRGLNPQAPLKPSGIEWLGDIPAHWDVIALKRLIEQGTSISYGIVQPGEPLEDGIPFVQTTNMSSGAFSLESLQRTSAEIAAMYPRSTLTGGEVILGIRASIGAAFVVPDHLAGANLSRGVARIVSSKCLQPSFLVAYFATRIASIYWEQSKQGSTFNEVSIETVREFPVLLPPLAEQAAIAAFLDAETAKFDALTAEAERAIGLLQERRTALISAAVTGQIDVRETT
jgi:type I restriction enzyme S subunit